MSEFQDEFIAGMKAYLAGEELDELACSEAFARGYKARELEDKLLEKKNGK